MYVCMYVCMYIYICIYIYVCMLRKDFDASSNVSYRFMSGDKTPLIQCFRNKHRAALLVVTDTILPTRQLR